MYEGTFKALLACARSMGAALICGAALTACGDGAATVGAGDAPLRNAPAGKPARSPVAAAKAPNIHVTPVSTPIIGNLPAPTVTADSITLSWAAPTENTDGSALTDLSGYEIYYGTSASELTEKISTGTVGLSNYVVPNLGSGTWYFEVIAVNALGFESAPSRIVARTL